MKTLLIIFLSLPVGLSAAGDKFVDNMLKNIDLVYRAGTAQELQSAVNVFERIAAAEQNRWEPYYYSAFGNIMLAIRERDTNRKDAYLDLAQEAIAKANQLNPQTSELAALEGFVYMIRVTIDPASRGQQYSAKAYESYGKALELNPENPRALALMAQMDFGTAQFFHAPTKAACAANQKAITLFSSIVSDNPLGPSWGESMANELRNRCETTK